MVDKSLSVSDFAKRFAKLANEIGCDGKGIASHDIRSTVIAYCEETDTFYDIVSLEPQQLMGCGCWYGVEIVLKARDEDEASRRYSSIQDS